MSIPSVWNKEARMNTVCESGRNSSGEFEGGRNVAQEALFSVIGAPTEGSFGTDSRQVSLFRRMLFVCASVS